MHLVDNVYLVAALCGSVLTFVSQVSNLVHGIVGCAVYLYDVETSPVHNGLPEFRILGNLKRRSVLPVQGFGKKPGRGGLAGSTRSNE